MGDSLWFPLDGFIILKKMGHLGTSIKYIYMILVHLFKFIYSSRDCLFHFYSRTSFGESKEWAMVFPDSNDGICEKFPIC